MPYTFNPEEAHKLMETYAPELFAGIKWRELSSFEMRQFCKKHYGSWGSFRACFAPPELPFVVKVALSYCHCRSSFEGERQVWCEAQKQGLEQYFAETYALCQYEGLDLYLCEKVGMSYLEAANNGFVDEPPMHFPPDTIIPFVKDFGIAQKIEKITMDFGICDLHSGNYRYSLSKKHLVYTDYGELITPKQEYYTPILAI